MILNKMKCPYGCENTTFTESVRSIQNSLDNLLLDGNNGASNINSNVTNIKVYTCNCCHKTFEIPQNISEGKIIL